MSIFIIIISFITLLWSANHLVTAGVGLAQYYHLSPLTISLTIISLGTTLPEIAIAFSSLYQHTTDIALGNAVGANIANIGLVLGITIILRPLTIQSALLLREYPILLMAMLFTYSLILDGNLSILDGCLLLLACIALIGYFLLLARRSTHDHILRKDKISLTIPRPIKTTWISLIIGFIVLPTSAHFLVGGAVQLGVLMGISQLVIGLTIIALGTSLPELVTAIVATYKGQDDIAIGTILGSNIFNLLIVMAFPSLIKPSVINHALLWRDFPVMFLVTFLLFLINYPSRKQLARWHGGLLLLIYASYIISLIFNATA